MRIIHLRLVNYIGIYNGLGLHEINIDFTRCKHKIIMLKGKNGSGKSTINKALSFFPDSNDNFIPTLSAEKEIDLWDNGIIYHMKFKHKISSSGKREVSKSYISKQIEDNISELNPNGNLSTYKEILYSELKLDPNFVSLSQLSSDDKGIVNKKPSERKKFVNNIINDLSTYNDINKTLTKRSSIFKSLINSITAKIDLIGDKNKVKLNLKSIEKRLELLIAKKDNLINLRSSNQSKISLLDPDGKLQSIGKDIINSIVDLKKKESDINNSITKYNTNNISYEEILNHYNMTNNNIISLKAIIDSYENTLNSLLLDRESENKELRLKTEKLNSLINETNYKELKENLSISKNKIIKYQNILSNIGIKDINSISKDEFILGLNTLKDIKEILSNFSSDIPREDLQLAINHFKFNYSLIDKNNEIESNINKLKLNNSELQIKLQTYKNLSNISKKLSLRPDNCKIDNCGFIKDALDALNKNPDKNIDKLELEIDNINKEINKLNSIEEKNNYIISIMNNINILSRTIKKNMLILNKLPINISFNSLEELFKRILNNDEFKEIDELYKYIDYSNIIDEYKSEKELYSKLNNQYELYKNKNIIIDDISNDISQINSKLNSIFNKIESSNKDLLNKKKELENNKLLILKMNKLIELFDIKKDIENKKKDIITRYNTVKNNLKTIQECLNNISSINDNLNSLTREINPLIEEKDKLKHGLYLLDQYNNELTKYKLKYEKIELIKKYSSPGKAGIQTLFMNLYMNKTISLANKLLALLFDGEYAIEKYVINDNEFRIPVSGNGYIHDDISSMSGGETSMISMIISFVLLQQSSTKYNILKLDEIDAALDNENRTQFLTVLDQLMDILEVEQCIMISHNEEISLSNCDVIKLRTSKTDIIEGNVIFDYQKLSPVI